MDDTKPKPILDLKEWEAELLRATLVLQESRYKRDNPLDGYIRLRNVVSQFPRGALLGTSQSMKLVDCLECACQFAAINKDETDIRRKLVGTILSLLDPWRQDEDGYRLKRRPLIIGVTIQSGDPKIFQMLLRLPGAPTVEQMLTRGWMQVDPEAPALSIMGMRPPGLPANTGPIPASIKWLALMSSRATQNNGGIPGHLSLAEKLLISRQGVEEPFLGERHLLEFALGPHVVEELVKRGADPTALTSDGVSRLEKAIRRLESTPHTILGMARLTAPGHALEGLPSQIRAEMAEAVAEVFMERFPSQGVAWPETVAALCGDAAQARTRSGARMVDKIARALSMARQIDDNPAQVLEQLGVDPATAGQGQIGRVPSWMVWEWLLLRHLTTGGVDNPSRGIFCQAAGLSWTPARMLPLVGTELVDMPNQAGLVYQAIEHDPAAALTAACAFFERLAYIPDPGMGLEFDAGMMLTSLSNCPDLARASPEVAGTLAPWLALFGKPFPVVATMDPACVLHSCERIEAIQQAAKSQGSFMGKARDTGEQIEVLRSAALMARDTPYQDTASAKPRF